MLKKIYLALVVAAATCQLLAKEIHWQETFDWTQNLARSNAIVAHEQWQATVPFFPAQNQPGLSFPLNAQGETASLLWNREFRLQHGDLETETTIEFDFRVDGVPAGIRQGPWVGVAFKIKDADNYLLLRLRFGQTSQYQVLQVRKGQIETIILGSQPLDVPLEYGVPYRIAIKSSGDSLHESHTFKISRAEQPDFWFNRITEFSTASGDSKRAGYAGIHASHFPTDGSVSLLGFNLSVTPSAFNKSRQQADATNRRQPLDFSLRPMMYNEHVFTHYFPEATWEPETEALRKRLATIPMAPRPRLFPGLESHPFADLPAVVSNTILGRARAMMTPGSANYLDLNAVGELDAHAGNARFMNQQLLDLLASWKITGETRYAEYAENFCRALLVAYPPRDEDLTTASAPGMDPHAVGELLQGLAMAYDLLYERFDPEFRVEFAATAARYMQIQLIRTRASYGVQGPDRGRSNWWTPYHNWTAIIGGSMGMLALTIEGEVPGLDVYPALWAAVSTTEKWLDEGFDPNGASLEGNHYIQFAYAYALPFMQALRARGGPDLFDSVKQEKALDYMVGELLPSRPPMVLNAWSSSHHQGLRWDYVPLLLANEYNAPLGLWLWENALQLPSLHPLTAFYYPVGMQPSDPLESGAPLVQFYPRRGLVNIRTGWKPEDRMFSFSSGPFFPTTHGQSDENSFHLYAAGEMLATEHTGRSTLAYRTEAHNAVLINNRGQAPSGGSRGVDGRLVRYGDHPAYTYLLGDAKSAYDQNTHGQQGIRVGRADRHVLYVKACNASQQSGPAGYFIMYDDIQHNFNKNTYTWLLHTSDRYRVDEPSSAGPDTPNPQAFTIAGAAGRSQLEVFFFGQNRPQISQQAVERLTRIRAELQAVRPDFLSLLLPLEQSDSQRDFAVKDLSGSGFSGGSIAWENGMTDIFAVDLGGGIELAGIETDAHLMHIRRDAYGEVLSWIAIDARHLSIDGELVINAAAPVNRMADENVTTDIIDNAHHQIGETASSD